MAYICGGMVACDRQLLSEYGLLPAVKAAAVTMAESVPRHDHRVSYSLGEHSYHCQIENAIIYICVTIGDDRNKARVAFCFLEDLCKRFRSAFSKGGDAYPRLGTLNPATCSKFNATLASRIKYFQQNVDSVDKIGKVQSQIDGVKEIMINNIEQVVARGEKIEDVVDATAHLNDAGTAFHEDAVKLRRAMWWKERGRWICVCIFLFLVTAVAVTFLACGSQMLACPERIRGGSSDGK